MRLRILPYLVPAAVAAVACVASCSSVQNSQIGISAPPYSHESFSPVGDYLGNRCGTLDCHGQSSRNFRVWGCEGMRLAEDASPASCLDPTSDEEYQATYRSLVGLEPQVMSSVYAGCAPYGEDGGEYPPGVTCHPELLTFIRKARGTEAHKGGQLICVLAPCPPGLPAQVPLDGDAGGPLVDPQDVCLVSWLEGATDVHECGLAFDIPTFPVIDAGSE